MTESILVVDDNREILEFLSEVLGETYKIHLAESAETALQVMDTEVIQLIVLDVMLPGMDGFELCQLVKSNVEYCHIPIVLLTSKNSHRSHITGLEAGADAYIRKPFSPEFLQVQIANLLNNRLKIKAHFATSPFEDVRVMAHSKTDETFLKQLDDYIRKNIQDSQIDIDKLAEHMNMSRPTFYRKIKSLSALSPKELIDITRLKKAAGLIAENAYSLAEISRMVGYSTQSLFSRNFQKHFKVSPHEYLKSLPKMPTQ
ncbi:response regulator [Chitinophaga niabensis]|uniref:response regulator transcription factor n=1 Tax=Chitinophaga niabensis TaxID=536979 RepID=UPI0031BA25AB